MNIYAQVIVFFTNGFISKILFFEWIETNSEVLEVIFKDNIKLYKSMKLLLQKSDQEIEIIINDLKHFLQNKFKIDSTLVNEYYCAQNINIEHSNDFYKIFNSVYNLINPEIPDEIEIDVSKIASSHELQQLLKDKLHFPSFYGMNWNAFWDAITGLVRMPKKLTFIGWENIENNFKIDAEIMIQCFNDCKKQYLSSSSEVIFK